MIQTAKRLAHGVDGWLTDAEGELLYRLAAGCTGRGAIVEVGSWKGKSTIWLASGSRSGCNAKVYAVDPHTGSPEIRALFGGPVWSFDEFQRNIETAGVGDLVIPVVATSEQAAQQVVGPLELVFIDGAHDYDSVRLDFELWFPKLLEGGVMAFHDSTCLPGPKRLVEEAVFKSRAFRESGVVDRITFARKTGRNRVIDRIRNRYVLARKHPDEFANRLGIPKPVRNILKHVVR